MCQIDSQSPVSITFPTLVLMNSIHELNVVPKAARVRHQHCDPQNGAIRLAWKADKLSILGSHKCR